MQVAGNLMRYHIICLVFSIVSIQFPEERSKYYGYCEAATGIGMMGGPIVG